MKRLTVNAATADQAIGVVQRELVRRGIATGPLTAYESGTQLDDQHVAVAVINDVQRRTFYVLFNVETAS